MRNVFNKRNHNNRNGNKDDNDDDIMRLDTQTRD